MRAEGIHLLIAAKTPRPAADETAWTGRARTGGGGDVAGAPVMRMLLSRLPITAPPVADEVRWSGARGTHLGTVEPSNATALLCNLLDVASEAEEEFNAWYDTEHLPRLGALPWRSLGRPAI